MKTMNDTMQGSAQLCPAVRDLPGRSDAEKALAAALSGGRAFSHAVAVPLARATSLVDQGLWRESDDDVLRSFLNLSRTLNPGDRIFRWSGTSLLVLFESADNFAEWIHDRSRLFSLEREPDACDLGRRIDLFVASSL